MSEDAHRQLQVVAALAIYAHKQDVACVVDYLRANGWTTQEAFDLIELYEEFRDQIKAGRLV